MESDYRTGCSQQRDVRIISCERAPSSCVGFAQAFLASFCQQRAMLVGIGVAEIGTMTRAATFAQTEH